MQLNAKLSVGTAVMMIAFHVATCSLAHAQAVSDTTTTAILTFQSNPAIWLTAARANKTPISNQVKAMIVANPSLAQAMVNFAKTMDPLTKANMAVGLAQAASDLAANDPADARTIQQDIALAGDTALMNSFTAGSNGVQTASTGPADGGTTGAGSTGTTTTTTTGSGTSSGSTSNSATTTSNTANTPSTNTVATFTPSSAVATAPSTTPTPVSATR